MSKVKPKEKGWTVEHPKYGTWFISRQSVIDDWKQDRAQAYPGEPVNEPDKGTVEIWFNEQISWIEVSKYGKQVARPDMDAFEKQWLESMMRNADCAGQ